MREEWLHYQMWCGRTIRCETSGASTVMTSKGNTSCGRPRIYTQQLASGGTQTLHLMAKYSETLLHSWSSSEKKNIWAGLKKKEPHYKNKAKRNSRVVYETARSKRVRCWRKHYSTGEHCRKTMMALPVSDKRTVRSWAVEHCCVPSRETRKTSRRNRSQSWQQTDKHLNYARPFYTMPGKIK